MKSPNQPPEEDWKDKLRRHNLLDAIEQETEEAKEELPKEKK